MKTAFRKSNRKAANAKAKRTADYAGAISLASAAADSLQDILRTIDSEVMCEIQEIASLIGVLRKEIAKLQPRKMHQQSIPAAGQELDAIVSATENASHRIIECAEHVMAADIRDPVRYKALVDAQMVKIFEACEFQDLTGQRIGKIIETLKEIETRVARFAEAAQPKMNAGAHGHPRPTKSERNSQEAIDRLLDGGASRR
jgi:chemotaxis protein CheZ